MESWKRTLAELVSNQLMSLKRQAFLLCDDESQAEDLVQDALVRAFARPLRSPRPGAAEAYVRVIMVHLFIDGGAQAVTLGPVGSTVARRRDGHRPRRPAARPGRHPSGAERSVATTARVRGAALLPGPSRGTGRVGTGRGRRDGQAVPKRGDDPACHAAVSLREPRAGKGRDPMILDEQELRQHLEAAAAHVSSPASLSRA
jgi:hypothetical protein